MPLDVFAFYNGLTEQAKGYPYLQKYGTSINQMALFQMSIQNNGTLLGRPSRTLINSAHAMGIKVLLVVSNLTPQGRFSTPLLRRLIRDQEFSNLVWRNIRNILVEYQCDGVNLDLEKAPPEDRLGFTQLIKTWSTLFHRANFLVTIDVAAKDSDDTNDPWKGSFDYYALGQAVDGVIIMTYEEHWPASPPGSVASLPWVTGILNYAIENIPLRKIYMGIPLYGYDWSENGGAQVIGYRRAIDQAQRYGAPLQWDATQHSTYYRYKAKGVRHTVYFEDPRSSNDKLHLASNMGIRGVAIWEMNLSYPRFWDLMLMYANRSKNR